MNNDFVAVTPDYQPWYPEFPKAIGTLGTASTSIGRRVRVWQPAEDVPEQFRYWCHGHSLSTYVDFGYSPFSAEDVETVLADEYRRIDKKPEIGDVIAFRARKAAADGAHARGAVLHSARVVESTQFFGMRTIIAVSSKNGPKPLWDNASIERVLRDYKACHWFKVEETCCGSERVAKQYYRKK